ncbi:PEPxxWA-CTERM sorting domain-containing protein [Novosphingobium sp. G106]|nr:PEPxxWA-CTERM sorting domain-containing protein [Novosphingobium sp. G106]MBV1688439.1 PEPxxWA-CTERM sorting domain-containing protein [Novosphingobium sp. G106]
MKFTYHDLSGKDFKYDFNVLNLEGHAQIAGYVPEPATWGLMILGIGFAGAAMRRPQTKLARQQAVANRTKPITSEMA